MFYETPPRFRGTTEDKFDVLWSYLYRLSEALNRDFGEKTVNAAESNVPKSTTASESRSFLVVLENGDCVPMSAFNGVIMGSTIVTDVDDEMIGFIVLSGKYPPGQEMPKLEDITGHELYIRGDNIGGLTELSSNRKPKKIIAV